MSLNRKYLARDTAVEEKRELAIVYVFGEPAVITVILSSAPALSPAIISTRSPTATSALLPVKVVDDVIKTSNNGRAEMIINGLLESVDVFEVKPRRLKVLE